MTGLPADAGSRSRWRKLRDRFELGVDTPTEFLQGEEALVAELTPHEGNADADAKRSEEVLREAQHIYSTADERAAGATTRATTLQGAVAIATSLLLAGSGLVFDQAKLQGAGWRVGFAVLLLGATFALVMTGLRALSATSTIHRWHRPTAESIVSRTKLPETEARIRLAAETLVDYSFNTKIAAWKVAYLGAAAWWFRIALGVFLALALLLGTYAIFGPDQSVGAADTGKPPAAQQKP